MSFDSEVVEKEPTPEYLELSPGRRFVISALVAFHLFAVFIAPFHFSTRSGEGFDSQATRGVRQFIDPYIQFFYLDHGYFFFAPDPGPSHLIRYEVRFADGRKITDKHLPDRDEHWPRLLYHRHFMMAETMYQLFVPPDRPEPPKEPPETASSSEVRQYKRAREGWEDRVLRPWERQRKLYESMRRSMSDHIRSKYESEGTIEEIRLMRVEHRLPFPDDIRKPSDMRDPRSYFVLPETLPREPATWNSLPEAAKDSQ